MISALRDNYFYVVADKDFFQISFKGPVRNIWRNQLTAFWLASSQHLWKEHKEQVHL